MRDDHGWRGRGIELRAEGGVMDETVSGEGDVAGRLILKRAA